MKLAMLKRRLLQSPQLCSLKAKRPPPVEKKMEAPESVVRGPNVLLAFLHIRLSREAIRAFDLEYVAVMERMKKVTIAKTLLRATATKASRPMEIEEEVNLLFVVRVTAPTTCITRILYE